MKPLSRDDLLAVKSKDLKTKDLLIPEWGSDEQPACVRIRNLTALGRGKFIQRSMELRAAAAAGSSQRMDNDLEILLVYETAVDEKGERLFQSMEEVGQLAGKIIQRIAEEAQEFSGLMPESALKAEKP